MFIRFWYQLERDAISGMSRYSVYDKSFGSDVAIASVHDSHYAGKIVEALNFKEAQDFKDRQDAAVNTPPEGAA